MKTCALVNSENVREFVEKRKAEMNQNQQNRHNFHKQPTQKKTRTNFLYALYNEYYTKESKRTKTVLHSHTHIAMSFHVIFFLCSFNCSDSYLIFECIKKHSGKESFVWNSFMPNAKQQKLYRCIHFVFIH